jgi:site-specific recombinase XerD
MTQALAEVLADADDPETVQKLLTLCLDDSVDASPGHQPTLSNLYELYLDRRRNRSPATVAQYKRTIPVFLSFAKQHETTLPGELTTTLVDQWVSHLFAEYNADATICTYTRNIRAWLRWIHKRDLCSESVYRILDKQELGLSPNARDEALSSPEAEERLRNLRQQRFGTALHALLELTWNTGLRIGEIQSLDLTDFDGSGKEIIVRHRPEEGTRIKNGREQDGASGDGERNILLHQNVVDALTGYVQSERLETTDEFQREPLFTTAHGRPARSTLRRWIYEATSCRWADHSSEQLACDGQCDPDSNICPYSYYPHAIRRGAIVTHLGNGLRPDRATERFDVSVDVIRAHYDPRSKSRRKDDRADAVRNVWADM